MRQLLLNQSNKRVINWKKPLQQARSSTSSINSTSSFNVKFGLIGKNLESRVGIPISYRKSNFLVSVRNFESEANYHSIANETLDNIQESIESLFEESFSEGDNDDSESDYPELNLSDGVLTMNFGKHGIWVINKQTPNKQLWWSSPLSGPRRYEYHDESGEWIYSRVMDENLSNNVGTDSLSFLIKKEIKELYGLELEL